MSLDGYTHYMEKEIFETSKMIGEIFNNRIDYKKNRIISTTLDKLSKYDIKRIEIIAS